MNLKSDCRHFPGDRPCVPHKETGVHCDDCTQYEPVKERILIIKLDATGDVLRTTAILPGLKEKYPSAEITWVTLSNSEELFRHNSLVHRVLLYDRAETFASLSVESFNVLVNLDTSPKSAMLASFCRAGEKLGFGLNEQGKVYCFNSEAEAWLEMGAFDDVKKRNTHTYQQLMLSICRLRSQNFEIVLQLSESEKLRAREFRTSNGILPSHIVIGMNTGASARWEQKKWTMDGYRGLIRRIIEETDHAVVLYGGTAEQERNAALVQGFPERVFIAQTDASVREFFSILNASDIVITGDTLALHAATALRKRVIAIFGPTSAAEIETYGRVVKVVSDTMQCQCYYKPVCTQEVNCMNTISPDRIFGLVQKEVKNFRRPAAVELAPDA